MKAIAHMIRSSGMKRQEQEGLRLEKYRKEEGCLLYCNPSS